MPKPDKTIIPVKRPKPKTPVSPKSKPVQPKRYV